MSFTALTNLISSGASSLTSAFVESGNAPEGDIQVADEREVGMATKLNEDTATMDEKVIGVEKEEPSFPRLGRLPPEIRDMVWEAALPGPRLVTIRKKMLQTWTCYRVWSDVSVDTTDENHRFFRNDVASRYNLRKGMRYDEQVKAAARNRTPKHFGFYSLQKLQLLSVSTESRAVVRKRYQKAFGSPYMPHQVYFDFNLDTLYLDREPVLADEVWYPLHLSDDVERVHRLAVFPGFAGHPSDIGFVLHDFLDTFKNVQNLTIVDQQHHTTDTDLVSCGCIRAVDKAVVYFRTKPPKSMWCCRYCDQPKELINHHAARFRMLMEDCPFNEDTLQYFQQIDEEEDGVPPSYDIPSFSYETVVTRDKYDEYKAAEKCFMDLQDSFEYEYWSD